MAKNDYLVELKGVALASRLRRLLNQLHVDGERVYRELGLDFKPKWFPALHLLSQMSPLSMTEISRQMCMSHPSSIEIVNELIRAGLVKSRKSNLDGRYRELSLTNKGEQICEELRPVWDAFRVAGEEANVENGNNFLEALGKLESALEGLSMYERIMRQLQPSNDSDKHSI